MKNAKKISLLLVLALVFSVIGTGCGKKKYEALDTSISGELDIMLWSGTSTYWQDMGHKNYSASEFTAINEAATYAVAKAFNEKYPNVKINLYAKAGGPDDNDTSWENEMENFKYEHGKYPDLFASMNLANDVARGMIADLSVFSDDPQYKTLNPSLMQIMNYYGFQAGLPQFIQPWGVFVNYELAEQNNIDVPGPNWTIDEYTTFVGSADNKTFWGAAEAPMRFITTGTKDVSYSIYNYSGTGDRVNINSEAVNSLLNYIPKWAKSALWKQWDAGNVSEEILGYGGWYDVTFFAKNMILTNSESPWSLGQLANPVEGADNKAQSNSWDIYPRPSTEYADNTVGIVLDPFAVYNYAMNDGNSEWSEEEKNKLKLAYTFAIFWVASTESWQARADQTYSVNGGEATALNDSFPVVTGGEFDKQMDIWFSVATHKYFSDKNKTPGFYKVLEIWEKGQMWDVSDKAATMKTVEDGSTIECLYEYNNLTHGNSKGIVGAICSEANWLDQVKAKLGDFNTTSNQRFVKAEEALRDGLKKYYGYTDDKITKK